MEVPDDMHIEEADDLEDETLILTIMDDDLELGSSVRDQLAPYAVKWCTGEASSGDPVDQSSDVDNSSEASSDELVDQFSDADAEQELELPIEWDSLTKHDIKEIKNDFLTNEMFLEMWKTSSDLGLDGHRPGCKVDPSSYKEIISSWQRFSDAEICATHKDVVVRAQAEREFFKEVDKLSRLMNIIEREEATPDYDQQCRVINMLINLHDINNVDKTTIDKMLNKIPGSPPPKEHPRLCACEAAGVFDPDARTHQLRQRLKGQWRGTAFDSRGDTKVDIEFLGDSRVVIDGLLAGWYKVDAEHEPEWLDVWTPLHVSSGALPVPFLVKVDKEGLHLACPCVTIEEDAAHGGQVYSMAVKPGRGCRTIMLERPEDFEGQGYCLLQPVPRSAKELREPSVAEQALESSRATIGGANDLQTEAAKQVHSEQGTLDSDKIASAVPAGMSHTDISGKLNGHRPVSAERSKDGKKSVAEATARALAKRPKDRTLDECSLIPCKFHMARGCAQGLKCTYSHDPMAVELARAGVAGAKTNKSGLHPTGSATARASARTKARGSEKSGPKAPRHA